jgi:hypothetical protein
VPYTAEISRTNPTCFLFLIDQSESMSDSFPAIPGRKKSDGVADAINRLLQTLALRCSKGEGIRDYFHVGVTGYGDRVAPALGGALVGKGLVPISDVANNPLRVEQRTKKVEDGAGGLVDQTFRFPVWFEPVAKGGTPMCEALEQAQQLVGEFIRRCPGCFPPIVINITDGDATDGNPEPASETLRALAGDDGNVLLFNAHISELNEKPLEYPDNESVLPDKASRLLFRMSSCFPAPLQDAARAEGIDVNANSRGFVFNADLVSIIRFLDIGTKIKKR